MEAVAKGQAGAEIPVLRLYDRIYRLDVLTVAWWLVWKNNGKPGIDGMSCRDIIDGPGAGKFLADSRRNCVPNAIDHKPSSG